MTDLSSPDGEERSVRVLSAARARPRWWTEVVLVVGFAWGYDEVRSLHGNVVVAGIAHGRELLHLDRLLHLDWSTALNHWLTHHHAVAVPLAGYYVVMHLGMTALVLLVSWWQGHTYRRQRNALLLLSLVGLAVYWVFPAAPPRLLHGFHDTVRQVVPAAYDVEAAKANLYAAMPSLHMAWALWCGVALWALSARRWVRGVAVAHPAVTVVTVLATGNHYVIDLLAGAAIVPISYAVLAAVPVVVVRVAQLRIAVRARRPQLTTTAAVRQLPMLAERERHSAARGDRITA